MRQSIYRWFAANHLAGDAVIALFVFVVGLFWESLSGSSERGLSFLVLLIALPLVFRRTFPVPVLLVSIAVELVVLTTRQQTPASASVLLVIYSTVVCVPNKAWGRVALTAGLLGAVAAPAAWYSLDLWSSYGSAAAVGGVIALAALVLVAYVAGDRRRADLDFRAAEMAALAERSRLVTAERDQRVQFAAAAERTRIARELHDIVAHSLAVIVVQADGGAAAAAKNPAVAADVLRTIADTSRQALSEMRSLVGVLRSDGRSGGSPDGAAYLPQPGVASLDRLVEQTRQSGVTVHVHLPDHLPALSPTVDLTVFRVVQEALTNVLKHAGPAASATVEIAISGNELAVEVVDDGRGAAARSDGAGNGLRGMRERVAVLDGTLWAGPRPGGGFRVRVVLPMGTPVTTPRDAR
ncbi:sensor histidine kinase [Nakamurella flavida]|uniref:histidine kinase n=1 Tax=Nakamurella flavida TaxID=363630 RepID=A0A938YJY2_9ACTN|nr:sensor histidine kinase [Nakamurella flavida]MBM9476073.1 sensor histidine kinase [Nakamurella flavida]MDP9777183.1 signal transduction histidine kinase [Nakamurella flavida]